MARARFIAALAALLLCLLPAAVRAESQTLYVNVSGGSGTPPAVGVKVDVLDMQGNLLGSGVTNDIGNATITFEIPEGVDKVLIEADTGKGQGRKDFAVTEIGNARRAGMALLMFTGNRAATGAEMIEL